MTIFSVQRFLEDHLNRRNLGDVDDYAIKVANVFDRLKPNASDKAIALALAGVRTVFFRHNSQLNRREFERTLSVDLRKKFKKQKGTDPTYSVFERGLGPVRTRLSSRRRSIGTLLSEFKSAVESRAIDVLWESRKKNRLRPKPEKIAQALLAVFAKSVVKERGAVIRELASGVGFVDLGVTFGAVMHLIELKILKGPFKGAAQLDAYMKTEGRTDGWLVLFDVRPHNKRSIIPLEVEKGGRTVKVIQIDVNPAAPNTMSDKIG